MKLAKTLALLAATIITSVVRGENPDPVAEMARLLHEDTWAARIVATVSEATATSSLPIGTPRSDEMFVWFDPDGLVCLSLGMLRIEVRPGELIAVHARNWETIYKASHDGLSIAEVIREELPPLWCPWLAIALEDGDPAAWPVVGSGMEGFDFTTYKPGGGMGSGPYLYTGGRMQDRSGAATVDMRFLSLWQRPAREVWTSTFDHKQIAMPLSRMRSYTLTVQNGRTKRTTRFEHDFVLPDSWAAIDAVGRQAAESIGDLGPPSPQLVVGDRCPVVNLSFPDPQRDAITVWKPTDAFLYPVRGSSHRPNAVVLALARADGNGEERLRQYSSSIEIARRGLNKDETRIVFTAHPVIATEATQGVMDTLPEYEAAWKSEWPPMPPVERNGRDRAIPVVSAGPASLLLDRVAPGADGAVVVIDRSGWITGVITPDVRGDALINAIADAVRSAAR